VKILFTGDLQLGAGLDLGVGEYGEGSRISDQKTGLTHISRIAQEQNCDAVAVLGDVFEFAKPKPWEIIAFQDFCRSLTAVGIKVLVLTGNHDVKSASLPTALAIMSENGVVVSTAPTVIPLDDVVFATLPWSPISRLVAQNPDQSRDTLNVRASRALADGAKALGQKCAESFPDHTPILGLHWSIEGAALPTGLMTDDLREPVISLSGLAEAGFKVVAASHIHKAQVIENNPAVVFYTGSPMVCNWGEVGYDHGVWIYNTAGAGSLVFHKVWDRMFVDLRLEDGFSVGDVDVRDALVRVKFTATPEEAKKVDQSKLRRDLIEAGARKVFIRPKIVRVERARVEMKHEVSVGDAFSLWLDSQDDVDATLLTEMHNDYFSEVRG